MNMSDILFTAYMQKNFPPKNKIKNNLKPSRFRIHEAIRMYIKYIPTGKNGKALKVTRGKRHIYHPEKELKESIDN